MVWGVLLPETFEWLDHSKHMQVVMRLVHPHGWSLLPSTVLHMLTCVFDMHMQFVAYT